MNIPSDLSRIMARIQEIQEHIQEVSGDGAPPPAAPPSADPQPSFSQALQSARAARSPSLPSLAAIQPLSPSLENFRAIPDDSAAAPYASAIRQSAEKYGIDPNLVSAVVQVESGGNPRAVSPAGAMGLMQLMPSNVDEFGVNDPFDPDQNIDAGAHQLANLLNQYNGNLDLALAGYNAGPGAVRRYNGVPPYPETQQYIQKVRSLLDDK